MKTLTDFGGVVILGQKPFPKSGGFVHDPWCAHGIYFGWGQIDGYSGIVYFGPVFTLLDGLNYWYPCYKGGSDSDVWAQWIGDIEAPMPPDYREHFGEAYNFSVRAKAFDKVLDSEMNNWRMTR
jgi:hypothetical protein